MTGASPEHFQEGNETDTVTNEARQSSDSTENDGNGENSSLQVSDQTMMMAVIPTAHPRTLHTGENSPPTGNPCATHDSSHPLPLSTISTAANTADPVANSADHHVATAASAFPAHSDHNLKEHEGNGSPDTLSAKHCSEPSISESARDPSIQPSSASSDIAQVMCKPESEPSTMPPKRDGTENEMNVSPSEVAKKPAHEESNVSLPPPLPMDEEDASEGPNEPSTPKAENVSKKEETKTIRKKRILPTKPGQSQGRWTHEEHQAFLEGLKVYGREWKKVADRIPTRTSAQIRSHAQKYFAKLAREESLVLQEQAPLPYNAVPREQSASMPPPALPPSTQRNVERILADPTGAQREVEDTLRALRERYRQLQIRLQERNRARAQGMGGGSVSSSIVEDEDDSSMHEEQQQRHQPGEVRHQSDLERRKRTFEDLSTRQHQQHDDMSSLSSNTMSPSLSSWSPSRELGDQELIAVHVLGGTLPHSASDQDLRNLADAAAGQAHSSASSVASDREAQDDATTESKRRRLSGDGEHKSDTDDSAQSDSMVL